MDSLTCTKFDYLEVVLATDNVYDIPEERFEELLSKCRRQYGKCFQTDLKEYLYRDLRMIKKINDKNEVEETKVYQTSCVEVQDDPKNKYKVATFYKKKLSPVSFPSTMIYDDVIKKRRTVFRINNKIYINFDKELSFKHQDGTLRHKVFINFNNNKDTDIKESMNLIQQLQESIC